MKFTKKVLTLLRDWSYYTSVRLADEKGSFPLYIKDKYLEGNFIKTLPKDIKDLIATHGIRNSHLTSIAPTGTISLTADNVSSGIEPPFSLYYDRTISEFDGNYVERVEDYAYRHGVEGRTANEISANDHVDVLIQCQKFIDSAVSKTCNVGDDVTYEQFKDLYYKAWAGGAKGITTFRAAGKRYGILNEVIEKPDAEACYIDPKTGQKNCD